MITIELDDDDALVVFELLARNNDRDNVSSIIAKWLASIETVQPNQRLHPTAADGRLPPLPPMRRGRSRLSGITLGRTRCLRSISPVMRVALQMRDGNDRNVVGPDSIDDLIGEAFYQETAG